MILLKNYINKFNNLLAELSGWLLIVIMGLLIADFVSRGMSMPIQGIGEIAVFSMVAIVYLGMAHTELIRGHVRVTAITSRLPRKIQSGMNIFINLLASATLVIVLKAAGNSAMKAYISKEAVAGTVPLLVWPVKFVIVIGVFFYLLQLIINTIQDVGKLMSECKK